MITFDYTGHYTCECGKEFKKSQSFNAHKSNCRIHLGEQRWSELEEIRKSRSVARIIAGIFFQNKLLWRNWNASKMSNLRQINRPLNRIQSRGR